MQVMKHTNANKLPNIQINSQQTGETGCCTESNCFMVSLLQCRFNLSLHCLNLLLVCIRIFFLSSHNWSRACIPPCVSDDLGTSEELKGIPVVTETHLAWLVWLVYSSLASPSQSLVWDLMWLLPWILALGYHSWDSWLVCWTFFLCSW